MAEAARSLSAAELYEGARACVEFSIDERQMRQFAELSGDFNPLHTDDEFARSKGFDGRVVYGALLIAKVSQLVGMQLPGRDSVWASVSLDFRSPLYIGQAAQIEATVSGFSQATGLIELELVLRRPGKLLAKGKAEVVVAQ